MLVQDFEARANALGIMMNTKKVKLQLLYQLRGYALGHQVKQAGRAIRAFKNLQVSRCHKTLRKQLKGLNRRLTHQLTHSTL
jgi:hypothetical protein